MVRQPPRFLAAAQEIPDSTVYVRSCGRVSQTCPQEVFRRRRGRSMSNFYWARGGGLRLRCQRRRGGASGARSSAGGAETLRRTACRPLVKIGLPSAGNEMSAAAAVCYISTGNFNKNVADFKVCVAVSQPARFAPAAGGVLNCSFIQHDRFLDPDPGDHPPTPGASVGRQSGSLIGRRAL